MKREKEALGIAVYSRKSRYTGRGESIENQIELCRQYAAGRYPGAKLKIFEDEGFSGRNMERPQFLAMMEEAKRTGFQAIICYRLDRISRNIGDFAKLIERLNGLSIDFVSIKEQFDTASPMGRAMMYIASVFSQLERETIAERIRDNMQELSKTGRWLGGTTPTGYASQAVETVRSSGKMHRAHKLRLIPAEARVVREIFQAFQREQSMARVEAWLKEQGITTKTGRAFTRFSIKGILENPVYLIADEEAHHYFQRQGAQLCASPDAFDGERGMMVYNKTDQQPGRAPKNRRDIKDWIVAVGEHQGLICGKDWIGVQELIKKNKPGQRPRSKNQVALLGGLMRCGHCGGPMRHKLAPRKNEAGPPRFVYMCVKKERSRSQDCRIKNVDGNWLDAAVCQKMEVISPHIPTLIRALEGAKKGMAKALCTRNNEIKRMQALYMANQREIEGLVNSLNYTAGTPTGEYITRQISVLHENNQALFQRKKNLEEELEKEEEGRWRHHEMGIDFERIKEMAGGFRPAFEQLSFLDQRKVLQDCFEAVIWNGEAAHVFFSGAEIPGEIPRGEDSK